MKRIVCLLLALFMVSGTCAVAERENFTGKWYLAHLETNGMTLSPEEANVNMSFELREDGTGALYKDNHYAEMHWLYYMDMVILGKGETAMSFTSQNGELITEVNGGRIVFSRNSAAAPVHKDSPELTSVTAEDFYGAWKAVSVTMKDVSVGMDKLGMDVQFVIGQEGVQYKAKGKATNWIPFELKGSTLAFSISGKGMTLTRREDGSLYAINDNQPDQQMHFEKIEP